ncbi:MAG: tRNA (adenosine(37)-N6)-dimethylallyltransferase MiaA [Balneolaceae bacterium]|nr:tRNA (adenosine(37)-N6)-dimethylallyltransferase MiaA [Balneolaceae bacterium]
MRIIILGPTAAGKTELSLQIAEELGVPVISVDSRQCYKHINIGTAKPTSEELNRVKHYNISLLNLDEDDSAIQFQKRAEQWEEEILANHEHVLYVGGSTLYLQSLIQPFDEIPDSDPANIQKLEQRIEREGLESVYEILKQADPAYVQKIDGMNRQRIIRALDVWMQTGRPFSDFHQNKAIEPDNNTLVFGLQYPRQAIYDRINRRTDQMIEAGLVEEVKSLLDQGYSKNLQALNTVGYKEIFEYLNGDWKLDKAIEKVKTHTRRYAKRQLTWFRRWEFIKWLSANDQKPEKLKETVLQELNRLS